MLVGRQGGVRVEAGRRRSAAPIHVTMRGAGDHNATVRRRRYSLSARTRHPAMTKNQRHDNAAFQAVAHASLYAFQAVTRTSLYASQAVARASLYAFQAGVHASLYAFQAGARASPYASQAVARASLYAFKAGAC